MKKLIILSLIIPIFVQAQESQTPEPVEVAPEVKEVVAPAAPAAPVEANPFLSGIVIGEYKVVGGRGSICVPGPVAVTDTPSSSVVLVTSKYVFEIAKDGKPILGVDKEASVGRDLCPMQSESDKGDPKEPKMKARIITTYTCPWGKIVQTTSLLSLKKDNVAKGDPTEGVDSKTATDKEPVEIEIRDELKSSNQAKKRDSKLVCRWRLAESVQK